MSRTSVRTNRVVSPVKFYLTFSGDTGFSYWDGLKKERMSLGDTINFVALDTRSTVVGFSEAANSRVFSNRVQSLANEELTVRCGTNVVAKGLWADIKEKVKAFGGKFCTEVFALVEVNGEYQCAKIDFSGATLGDWMDFVESVGGKWNIYKSLITVTKGEERKKGRVTFHGVAFETGELPVDVNDAANAFNDDVLQPYLSVVVATAPVEDSAA